MKLNPLQLILDADIVVKFVIILLLASSVYSWSIMIQKFNLFRSILKSNPKYLLELESQPSMSEVARKMIRSADTPLARMLFEGSREFESNKNLTKIDSANKLQSLLSQKKQNEMVILENRLSFLATTASAAPFIGLFGTVWGIMNSFLNIGASGSSSLAVVAPGIAEALIATAIGLFAAIPAVIGYNYFIAQIRRISQDMDQLIHTLFHLTQK